MSYTDHTGKQFGLLTVIHKALVSQQEKGASRSARWVCRCVCGVTKSVSAQALVKGDTRSCGRCIPRVKARHGQGGTVRTKTYVAWQNMIARCTNPKHKLYRLYGGRGIGVCQEWIEKFEAFYECMGDPDSSDLSLDRIDNEQGYRPGNCRWTTMKVQSRNRRGLKLSEEKAAVIRDLRSSGMTLKAIAVRFGVCDMTIHAITKGGLWS